MMSERITKQIIREREVTQVFVQTEYKDGTTEKKQVYPWDKELEFEGQILDNVHGFISYTHAEKKIMETQLFRRLQSIKQLSVVNWVFPGSEHTRYIHSLGVMHIADKMAISLGLTNRERRILRLAGLLHDVGHYPLSHVGEYPYNTEEAMELFSEKKPEQFCKRINKDVVDRIRGYKGRVKTSLMKTREGYHHEAVGAAIVRNNLEIRQLLEDELGPDAHLIVSDIICGNVEREEMDPVKRADPLRRTDPLWVQIMHSELDADGIDYIMRDSASAGTSFGTCEIDQLIRCLTVGELRDGTRILCVKPKGVPAADQYLVNKFFHYSQVVFNRHIVISEFMAMKVINWMRENSRIFPDRDTMDDWMAAGGGEAYLAFTDDMFWGALPVLRDDKSVPEPIRCFCRMLLRHDEPVLAKEYEIRIVSRDPKAIAKRLKQSDTYTDPTCHGKWITALESRTMTSQAPYPIFRKQLEIDATNENKGKLPTADKFHKYEVARLMECICVRDEKGEVYPLCDYERSLMQDLYDETVTILRSYAYPAK